jgi:hypothetical protein
MNRFAKSNCRRAVKNCQRGFPEPWGKFAPINNALPTLIAGGFRALYF